MFGRAYDHQPASARPVYGALNFRRRDLGGSPRFGSAHLRLKPSTVDRTTFCHPDSFSTPTRFGVAAKMSLIPLVHADDPLDDYIEAQVHGPLLLAHDVEALVLDPCYGGTDVERDARALPCPVEWHGGFRVSAGELRRHPGYRGPQYVELGTALARDGHLDPGSSVTRPAPATTTSRCSSGSGTTSLVSGPPRAGTPEPEVLRRR